jgi:hypothetical protein
MADQSFHCALCEKQLNVSESVRFLTCPRCQARLAIRRTETASYTIRAAEEEIAALQDQVREFAAKLDLMQLDLKWNLEKLTRGEWPESDKAVAAGCLIAMLMTCGGMGLGGYFISQAGNDGFAWIFGLALIVGAPIVLGLIVRQGVRYHEARDGYLRRRAELSSEPRKAEPTLSVTGTGPSESIQTLAGEHSIEEQKRPV